MLESQACHYQSSISIITNNFLNNLCCWKKTRRLQLLCGPLGDKETSLLLSPILWPLSLGFSHNFPCQLFFFSRLSPTAWAAQPLQQWCLYLLRGLESTKSCSITRNTLPSAWSPTQFRSGKDFLGHVAGDLKGSPAVQGYPSAMLPISMDIFQWKDLISVKQKEDKEKRLNERCSHWDKAVSAQPG